MEESRDIVWYMVGLVTAANFPSELGNRVRADRALDAHSLRVRNACRRLEKPETVAREWESGKAFSSKRSRQWTFTAGPVVFYCGLSSAVY
jgi:hypothetical protein